MIIEQFYDKGLAHASYAIVSNGEMAVVDPARDPQPYYDFAHKHNARIIAVIETHPHADFVSSHAEIAGSTGATIYVSKLVSADYPHKGFDEGDTINVGKISLKSMNTPGHSPDSISILLLDESGKEYAVFTGDTLFVGDVGRPDLRESAGSIQKKREQLAEDMYYSTRDKLMKLPEETLVYPAHGAGSLCGKNLGPELHSTIGKELRENYALQPMDKDRFVSLLLEDQPFIPKYFGYDVSINKNGASRFEESIEKVPQLYAGDKLDPSVIVVDTRPRSDYEKGHVKGAINIMDGGKFETWLGSIVGPGEKFYLIVSDQKAGESLVRKAAKIGYEKNIAGVLQNPSTGIETSPVVDVDAFKSDPDSFTIVDIRNPGETRGGKIFKNSILIPLPELRERVNEIPMDKPVLVHCAGGYRSAAGASIVEAYAGSTKVYDLSDAVNQFGK